jgi:hypothetical protein
VPSSLSSGGGGGSGGSGGSGGGHGHGHGGDGTGGQAHGPSGHALEVFAADTSSYRCDLCQGMVDKGCAVHGCRRCDYDVCGACVS